MYALKNARLSACYEQGLSDERKVIDFLRSEGYQVEVSTEDENKWQDIDCWVNGKPVSIKAQHKGHNYHNIGFELANQLTTRSTCKLTQKILSQPEKTLEDIDSLVRQGSWERSWWDNGAATNYLIYQHQSLRLYTKESLRRYIKSHGFLRIRPLSDDTRSYLGGRYRHCNSISGYLDWGCVPHRIWKLI